MVKGTTGPAEGLTVGEELPGQGQVGRLVRLLQYGVREGREASEAGVLSSNECGRMPHPSQFTRGGLMQSFKKTGRIVEAVILPIPIKPREA